MRTAESRDTARPGTGPGPTRGVAAPALRWIGALVAVGTVFAGVFLLYFLVYRVRHFSLPLGWDTPWYVWRADFVGHVGIGPLDTAARPGHALLSATLTSLTGLSALRLQVVLPFVLVAVLPPAVGALVAEGTGPGEWWRWAAAAAVSGVTIGTTRLVGENVSSLMNVLFVAVAFLLLIRFASAGRGFTGAVLVALAASLAHWLFMAVFALIAGAWFVLALPGSLRARRAGVAVWRTEAGALAGATAAAAAATAALISPVLGSTFRTREIGESKRRFLPKLGKDFGAMQAWAVLPAAAAGAVPLAHPPAADRGPAEAPAHRGPFLRMLVAWTAVCAAGMVLAWVTLAVPPHRFLGLLVAVPVAVALAAAVWTVGRWVARRGGRAFGITAGAVIVAALAVPTVAWWYGPKDYGGPEQWFDQAAFDQSRSIQAYIETLPAARPVVVLVGPLGSSGPISISLKERTVRAGLAPQSQERVFVVPDEPADALAGRFSHAGDRAVNDHNRLFFDLGKDALRSGAPIVVPEALGPKEFRAATKAHGARVVAPGMAVLRGPSAALGPSGPLHVVPATEAGTLWAVVLVVLLGVAGLGWTAWFVGPGARPLTLLSLAPSVGAAMLVLGALVTVKLGLHPAGPAGVATFAVAAGGGFVAFAVGRRRWPSSEPVASGDGAEKVQPPGSDDGAGSA